MKIKVKPEGFVCTGSVKTLIEGLSRVMLVTGYVSSSDVGRHHLLVAYKGNVFLCGYSTETGCILKLEGYFAEGDGAVSLQEPEKLSKLLKGRTEIKFTYKDQILTVGELKGNFKSSVASNFVTYDQSDRIHAISQSVETDHKPMGSALLTSIREGVNYCRIADVHMNKTLLCMIKFDGKYVHINSTCDFHAASYVSKAKCKTKPFMIALPANMFKTVDKFVGDDDVTFIMTPSVFVSHGKNFIVSFPPIDIDAGMFDAVNGAIESMAEPLAEFEVCKGFHTLQVNFSAYATNGERMMLKLSDKKVQFSLDTDSGSASDSLKPKHLKSSENFIVPIDPRTLDDIFKICPKSGGIISFYPMDKGSSEIRAYRIVYKTDAFTLNYIASTLE
tara:strand:+ start:247 stop:1413 length:1167 start_codon:yes stop_codon:yes gene_type:complete